jgi:hypothetical protein
VVQNNFLCRWIDFGSSLINGTGDPSRSFCINGDFNNHTTANSNYNPDPVCSISSDVLTIGLRANSSPDFITGMELFASDGSMPDGVFITGQATQTDGSPGGAGTYNLSSSGLNLPGPFTCIGVASLAFAQYWCISDNYFFGTQYALDLDDGFNCPISCQWTNTVAQRNACNSLTLGAFFEDADCTQATFRDNLAWNCGANGFVNCSITTRASAAQQANAHYQVYRNKIYQSEGVAFAMGNSVALTSTRPLVFTDNQVLDTRSGSSCDIIELNNAATEHSTSVIDRNNYLCPNATAGGTTSSAFQKNNGVVEAFTTWQAIAGNIDPNSTATTAAFPVWIDPANGHFT